MSEPYRYGIYEKALFKKPLPQLLEDAARAGFDNFELSLDETDERLGRLDWEAASVKPPGTAAYRSTAPVSAASAASPWEPWTTKSGSIP